MSFGNIESIANLSLEEELEIGRLIHAKLKTEERINNGEEKTPGMRAIIRKGDRAAEKLIRANVRLVHYHAHRFKRLLPSSPSHEDLFAAGLQGLWTAAMKYNPDLGFKFSTVATHWIYQAIVRSVNNTHRLVRLPENRIEEYTKILSSLRNQGATDEDTEEVGNLYSKVAEDTGISEAYIHSIMNAGGNHASLNKKVSDEDDSKELLDVIGEINNVASAEDAMMLDDLGRILSEAIEDLDEVERAVVSATNKMSLDGTDVLTQKATKEKYNLTSTDYRKTYEGAISKMKALFETYSLGVQDFF